MALPMANLFALIQAEWDPRYVRAEAYLAAQLLQSIHGFSSGSKRLYEWTDSTRSMLVNHSRCISLFDRRPSATSEDGDKTLDQRWEVWIRSERLRRLAWAIFVSSPFLLFGAPSVRPQLRANPLL